jgi:hypothetical protein
MNAYTHLFIFIFVYTYTGKDVVIPELSRSIMFYYHVNNVQAGRVEPDSRYTNLCIHTRMDLCTYIKICV